MKQVKNRPAIAKGIAFIQAKIASGIWKQGFRLPSYYQLAELADVSFGSMCKAIAVLKKDKVLSGKQGIGTYVGTFLPVKKTGIKPVGKHIDTTRAIAEKIKQDVLKGTYNSRDTFPSFKELKHTYKAGYRVIKRAVNVLVDEEVLSAYARRYSVKQFSFRTSTNTIYLLVKSDLFYQIITGYEGERSSTITNTLEMECTARSINLVKIPIEESRSITSEMGKSALGFFIWYAAWIENDIISRVLSQLVGYNKPLAICNMIAEPDPFVFETLFKSTVDPITLRHRTIFIYNHFLHDKRAGFLTGRFLYGKGHRKICYFARQEDRAWAHERLAGLKDAFESLGVSNAVVALLAPPSNTSGDKLSDQSKVLDGEAQFLLRIESVVAHNIDPHRYYLHDILKGYLEDSHFRLDIKRIFPPLFKSALQQKDCTAWVCSTGYIANYTAHVFLKSHNIKVPQQIGLLAIDDQIASIFNNITSFNFNFPGLARTMLNSILYPNLIKLKKGDTLWHDISVDGMVIDRGSV